MADHLGGPGRVARFRGELDYDFSLLFWLSRIVALALSQDDILGTSLAGREPQALKCEELRFWLKCRGDSLKGVKTKAELVKRQQRYIFTVVLSSETTGIFLGQPIIIVFKTNH